MENITTPSIKKPESLFLIRFLQFFENMGVLLILAIVLLIIAIIAPRFYVLTNITNLLITSSIIAVTGFGMTLAIARQGLDLSVGSIQAFTACIAASLLGVTNIPLTILGTLIVGMIIGTITGLIISKLRVPPFVATLGMMNIVRGGALLFTNGKSVLITEQPDYALLNTAKIFGIPSPLLIALLTLLILYIVLNHTPFGRHICAIGGNEAAAVTSGLKVDRITVAIYALVGVTAALSGVMLSSQLMIVDGTLGTGLELKAITVVVLGGTSMNGGNGNIPGTFFGALLLTAISSALNILKVPAFYQYMATGLLLIFALGLDTLRRVLVKKMVLGK